MRLFFAAVILMAATIPAGAQWLDRRWPGIPRTADGKPNLTAPAPRGPERKPDLTGVWNGPPPFARPDPANLQSWVTDLVRQRQQEHYKARPYYQCRPSGPEAARFGGWKRILQTATAIAILNDDLTYRVIHMDGRELEADPAPSWMGYSVGRWEGETLVVDSSGFTNKTWVSRYGVSHTEALRVTERYRRPDFGHLEVEVTFTDPGAFAKPWGFDVNFALAADTEMLEAVCERSSEDWAGSLSDAAKTAVTVAPDVLAQVRRRLPRDLPGSQALRRSVALRRPIGGQDRRRRRRCGPWRPRSRGERAAAAGAAISDAVRRAGTGLPVHCRRQGCGDGPRGDSRIGRLSVPEAALRAASSSQFPRWPFMFDPARQIEEYFAVLGDSP